MSQNDFTIANQGFPAFRADLNSALQALASNSSGATAPSTTFANMWWYDSANNIMYIRNEDNDAWIKFAELDQTNDKFVLSGTLQLDDGTVSAPALTFNSDTNTGIYRGGTDILKFVTAGTDAITIDASQNTTFAGTVTSDGMSTNTAGTSNFIAGVNAGNSIASGGNFNTVVGDEAGTALTTGDDNTAFGYGALFTEDEHGKNTAIGTNSLLTLNAGVDGYNTAVGYFSGRAITTGIHNTLIGANAGDALTDADTNVAVGSSALTTDTLGSKSTAVGHSALEAQNFTSSTLSYNTAIGSDAGKAISTGIKNTIVGSSAGDAFTTGNENTIIGYFAGTSMTTSNSGNTMIGANAGQLVTSGTKNTILGRYNGNQGGLDIRTSSNNIVLSDGDGNPRLSCNSNGLFAMRTDIDQGMYIYTGGTTSTNGKVLEFYDGDNHSCGVIRINQSANTVSYVTSSDYRIKENVTDLTSATTRLKQLQPKQFSFILDPDSTIHDGFMAHEVQTVVPEAISGTKDEVDADGNPVYQGIDQSKLVPLLTGALKEAIAKIEDLETRIAILEGA